MLKVAFDPVVDFMKHSNFTSDCDNHNPWVALQSFSKQSYL